MVRHAREAEAFNTFMTLRIVFVAAAAPWTESERRCLTRAFSGAGSQDKLSSAARPNVNNSSSIGSHDEIEVSW